MSTFPTIGSFLDGLFGNDDEQLTEEEKRKRKKKTSYVGPGRDTLDREVAEYLKTLPKDEVAGVLLRRQQDKYKRMGAEPLQAVDVIDPEPLAPAQFEALAARAAGAGRGDWSPPPGDL